MEGLTDRSRRPYRHTNQLPLQIERERLARLYPDVHRPAISTVHAVLDRHGLVKRGRKRRHKAQGTALSKPLPPNDLWCADYKGEFMLADRRYCYPLTITDFASSLPAQLRGAGDHQGDVRLHRVRAGVQGVRLAPSHPHRQRRALRQSPMPCSA